MNDPGGSFWSVDGLVDGETIGRDASGFFLARMVHATKCEPGGVRYLLVDRTLVQIRDVAEDDDSPKISYGLAFTLLERRLRRSVESRSLGRGTFPIPVITEENFGACVRRRRDAESRLRAELRSILSGLGESAPEGEGPPEQTKGGQGGPPWALRMHVVNVGQGDTIVLEFPGGQLWLIDAYSWRESRLERLGRRLRQQIPGYRVARAIVSHFHYDHTRSMQKAIEHFAPAEVLVPHPLEPPTSTTVNLLREARVRGVLREVTAVEDRPVGSAKVKLIPTTCLPGSPRLRPDPNEHGIVVAVRTDKSIVLLPGDVPGHLLAHLVRDRFFNGASKQRFYKVTHHCSRTGNDSGFLQAFQANEAATSCGALNRYGHPHDPPDTFLAQTARSSHPSGRHRKTFEEGCQVLTYGVP